MEGIFRSKDAFMRSRGRKAWHSSFQLSDYLTRDMSSLLEPETIRVKPLAVVYTVRFLETEQQLTNHRQYFHRQKERNSLEMEILGFTEQSSVE